MLDDLSFLEREEIEHRLYSQVYHSTNVDENVAPVVVETEMPRRNLSYRPVRYFLRKKSTNTPRSKEQPTVRTVNSQEQDNLKEIRSETDHIQEVTHPYPINNILVLPKNSETVINVFRQGNKKFAIRKIFDDIDKQRRQRRLRKQRQRMKKEPSCGEDLKPIMSEIKLRTRKPVSNINKHTIILSDSEDDIVKTSNNVEIKKLVEKKSTKQVLNDKNSSTDDDVIIVESQNIDEIIEIDDGNTEEPCSMEGKSSNLTSQYKANERNELLSTPESSASNDFIENPHVNTNPKFNFDLHGVEFRDSEFLRPTVPVDISESGSVSSVSDVSTSMKANVFNVVEFPKENLFDENNLEKFKNSITPKRNTKNTNLEESIVNISDTSLRSNDKDLPTLSDIESVGRRERGRSIIKELVNDRAYVLLSSTKKKLKNKKRKQREDTSESIIDDTEGESYSLELSKKKKKKKNKKDDKGNCLYEEFTDESELNNLIASTPTRNECDSKKSKKRRENSEEESDILKKNSKIAVRADLYPEPESDVSTGTKKSKKTKKFEQNDDESKQYKNNDVPDELKENYSESCRKRKKDKSVSESEINDVSGCVSTDKSYRIKKKKKKNVETDEQSNVELEDEIADDSRKKRKKKKSQSENQGVEELSDSIIKTDEDSSKAKSKKKSDIENSKNKDDADNINENVSTSNKDEDISSKSEKLKRKKGVSEAECILDPSNEVVEAHKKQESCKTVSIDKQKDSVEVTSNSQETFSVNENIVNYENSGNNLSNEQDSKSIFPTTHLNPILVDTTQKDVGIGGNVSEKAESPWSMCSNKFFSSSQSLFTVSNIQSEVEWKGDKDNAQNKENYVDEDTKVPSSLVLPENTSEKKTSQETNINSIATSEVNTEVTNEDQSVSLLTKVKEEKETADSSQISVNNVDVSNVEKDIEHEKIVKIEAKPEETATHIEEKQSLNVNLPQTSNSSEAAVSPKLPDIINKIVNEKDGISSMTKLCEFLEEVNDPSDVLKKVSMIKQAFLAKTINPDVQSLDSVIVTCSNDPDDVLSISSDNSSIICIEEDSVIIDIDEDVSLANCDLSMNKEGVVTSNPPIQEENLEQSEVAPPVGKKNDSQSVQDGKEKNSSAQSDLVERFRHEEIFTRGLDKYEVEAIQEGMSDDPKLWQICSDDLYQRRPPAQGKRCLKCREMGHLNFNCPNKYDLPKCFLCGNEGHLEFKCPNKICLQCGRKSEMMQNVCKHCKQYKHSICSLCKMKGHSKVRCPDLWRRYHLTVEPGPLVTTDGRKLKQSKDLWCSCCAKPGHLEHYCYFAQRNRLFQPLDPRVHQYVDVYNTEPNTGNNASKNPLVSKEVYELLQKNLDNRPEKRENIPKENNINLVQAVSSIPCTSNQAEDNEASTLPSSIESQINSTVASIQSNFDEGIENLPSDFVIVDEVCDTSYKSVENSISVEDPKEVNINKTTKEINDVISSNLDTIRKNNIKVKKDENVEMIANTEEEKAKSDRQSVESSSKNDLTADSIEISKRLDVEKNDSCDPDFDVPRFFMNADQGALREFIRKELELLKRMDFKVKDFFYRYFPYEEDDEKPKSLQNISSLKKRKYYKELNMLLFGREQFKAGSVNLKKLEVFINTVEVSFTKSIREMLYHAYDYIFRDSKHNHVHYVVFLQKIMRKHRNQNNFKKFR